MHRRDFLSSCVLAGSVLSLAEQFGLAAEEISPTVTEIGSRRELFLDDALLESLSGVERQLHHPVPQEVALTCDAPWEGTGSGYFTVFQTDKLYQMYYRGSHLGVKNGKLDEPRGKLCYAESDDGIHWRKPELGLFEFEGSKKNNIVLGNGEIAGLSQAIDPSHTTAFRDENPAAPGEARYKAFASNGNWNKPGLFALGSADGLTWKPLASEPIITDGKFDSQNLAFWDAMRGEYRAYYRDFKEGRRDIKTATSQDFIHWTKGEWLEYPGAEPEQLYTNQIKPYYRAPHLFIGFPTRYVERGWSDSMRALPDRELREQRAAANLRYGTALTDSILMSSRDGRSFARWGEAFLRPGLERSGTWNYGNQYVAWQAVETRSTIDSSLPELSIYAPERYWHGAGTVLRRYTLRVDGFVSLHASQKMGTCITRPIIFQGKELRLNFSTSAAGSIRVALQYADGPPVPDFGVDDCQEVYGDSLERTVTWKKGSDLSALAGKPIQMKFFLRDADLFSYQFVV